MIKNYYLLVIQGVFFSRYYRPLMWVYYLTIPGNTIEWIWVYVMTYFISKLIFEIPSGYIWDEYWHKKSLVAAQVCMLLGVSLFAIATNHRYFIVWCIIIALAHSLNSGTKEAYFHELLEDEWRETEFWPLWWRLKWDIAWLSIFFLVLFPRLGEWWLHIPFWVWVCMAAIWIVVTLLLPNPHSTHQDQESLSIAHIAKSQLWTNFYPLVWFFVIAAALYMSEGNFKQPYIVELGLSVTYIWVMLWLSRFIVRIFGASKLLKKLDDMKIQHFLLLDTLLIAFWYFLVSRQLDPIVIMGIFAVLSWYYNSRKSVIKRILLWTLENKKYKATLLSIHSQIESLVWAWVVVWVWYLMWVSYTYWYSIISILVLWASLLYYLLMLRKKVIK